MANKNKGAIKSRCTFTVTPAGFLNQSEITQLSPTLPSYEAGQRLYL